MITFKGTQKEFFKAYPKDKRSLDEVYELESSNGKTQYKFIGGLGEKCFKKLGTKLFNEIELNELEDLKQAFSTMKPGSEEDVRRLQAVIKNANSWNDFINIGVIALLNRLNTYTFYADNEEAEWDFEDDSSENINEYINIINKHIGIDVVYNEDHRLYAMKLYDDEIELLARLRDEWRTGCCSIMKSCRAQAGFDFNVVKRINKLIENLGRIKEGYINVIDDIASDYKWFGDTFSNFKISGLKTSVSNKFANLNYYLSQLYISYHEKLGDIED